MTGRAVAGRTRWDVPGSAVEGLLEPRARLQDPEYVSPQGKQVARPTSKKEAVVIGEPLDMVGQRALALLPVLQGKRDVRGRGDRVGQGHGVRKGHVRGLAQIRRHRV